MPSKAAAHGAPARRYLNEKVTGVLLEGLKRLAADQYV
jgi:COMPASS component SDC1